MFRQISDLQNERSISVKQCNFYITKGCTVKQTDPDKLIPTVFRALLKSAALGTDHQIHITKRTGMSGLRVGIDRFCMFR